MARRLKEPPNIPHIHEDDTIERIRSFAEASDRAQLRALTHLRIQAVSPVTIALGGVFSLAAVSVAAAAALVAVQPGSWDTLFPAWWVLLAVLATVAVTVIFGWVTQVESRRIARAQAHLAAYEAELARRYAARGREARRWQRAHPIRWERSDSPGGRARSR